MNIRKLAAAMDSLLSKIAGVTGESLLQQYLNKVESKIEGLSGVDYVEESDKGIGFLDVYLKDGDQFELKIELSVAGGGSDKYGYGVNVHVYFDPYTSAHSTPKNRRSSGFISFNPTSKSNSKEMEGTVVGPSGLVDFIISHVKRVLRKNI